MKRNHRHGTTLSIMSALAIGAMALPSIGAEQIDPTTRTSPEAELAEQQDPNLRVLQGRVVNLQSFLTTESPEKQGKDAKQQEGEQAKTHAASDDAPLGLCVYEEGVISALSTEQTYLIIPQPGDNEGEDAYEDARDMIGKHVAITGRVVERGSLSAIVIDVIQDKHQQASAEDASY